MATRRWQIAPLVGLGPLRFGMDRAKVAPLLDPLHPVTAFNREFDGSYREFRGLGMPVVSYVANRATGFEADHWVEGVYLDEFEVYTHPSKDVLQFLEHKNGPPLAGLGFVLFDKLAINTTGFYDETTGVYFTVGSDQDERSLSVYEKGAFDAFLGRLHPISFAAD